MNNKIEEVIGKMTDIALEKIKHYFTDFTMYDIPTLVTSGGISYIWLVRDTGTWLIDIDHVGNAVSCELLKTVIKYSDEAYWINLEAGTVEQMPLDFDFLKTEIEKFGKEKEADKKWMRKPKYFL